MVLNSHIGKERRRKKRERRLAFWKVEAGHGCAEAGRWVQSQPGLNSKTLSQNQNGRSGSSERTCAKITKLSKAPRLPAARHINNVAKTMRTQRQRPLRCTRVAATLTLRLHRKGLSVAKAQKGWYSGLDSNDSSDLKLPCFQNVFSCSPHYKLLKALLIFVKYCRRD